MNTTNETYDYVYTTIPVDYICVYHAILTLMADYGEAMLKDCKARCVDRNENIIDCYNMFNSAVAARRIGNDKLAETLIKYIKARLNSFGCKCDNTSFAFKVGINSDIDCIVDCKEGVIDIKTEDSKLFYYFEYNNIKFLVYVPNHLNPYTHQRFIQLSQLSSDERSVLSVDEITRHGTKTIKLVAGFVTQEIIDGVINELKNLNFSVLERAQAHNAFQDIYGNWMGTLSVNTGDAHEEQPKVYQISDIVNDFLPNMVDVRTLIV